MNPSLDYRKYLKNELEKRCRRNPLYSLRSYARDLGLSPGRLSDILKNKSGLSVAKARAIAKILEMSRQEADWFTTLVESSDARAKKNRTEAQKKIIRMKDTNTKYLELDLDQFKVISAWQHLAIIDLIQTRGFNFDSVWIAKRLGISKIEVEQSLERLLRLGLLKTQTQNGKTHLKAMDVTFSTPTDIPSDAIKTFHRQILEKALGAIDLQGVESRDFSCLTFPISKSLLPEAKKRIKKFRREFNQWVQDNKIEKEEVYSLGIYLFSLTGG
jgi:uncharacterized protein (TIGR02147 family)